MFMVRRPSLPVVLFIVCILPLSLGCASSQQGASRGGATNASTGASAEPSQEVDPRESTTDASATEAASSQVAGVGSSASRAAHDSSRYDALWRALAQGETARVIDAVEERRAASNLPARWHALLGEAYQVQGSHRSAVTAFEASVRISTARGDAPPSSVLRSLAQSYVVQARTEEARSIYRDLLDEAPEDVSLRNQLARLAAQANDWFEAKVHYERLIAADASNGLWQARLGQCYQNLGRTAPALEHLRTAHRLRPQDPAVALQLSALLRATGARQDAASVIETSLNETPTRASLWRRRADLAFERSALDTARSSYEQTLAYGDSSATVYRRLGIVASGQERYADAIPPLKAAYQQDSTSTRTKLYLGIAYREVDRLDIAARYLRGAVQSIAEGTITDAYVQLAQTEDERGNLNAALEAYRMARRLHPDRTELLFRMAQLYDRYYEDKTVAARYYRQFLNTHPPTGDSLLVSYAKTRLNALRPIIHMQVPRDASADSAASR